METLASWFELYLKRSDLRPASIRFKRKSFEYFLSWFGDLKPAEVTVGVAEDYRTLLAKGRKKKTANGYLANLKPFFKWLWENGRIPTNPFKGIRSYRITESRKLTFTAYELSRMIQLSSRLWRVRICLGLLGMRRGEMLNLTVREINQSGPHSHILLSPKNQSQTTWPWDLKDYAVRMVALPETMSFAGTIVELHKDLVRVQEDLPDEQPYVCLESKYYRKMIRFQQTNKLTDRHIADPTGNFQRFFRQLQYRAAIKPLKRFHEFRAAFATKMIASKGLEYAADALGHSSVEITRRYDRRSQETLVAEIGRLTRTCYET